MASRQFVELDVAAAALDVTRRRAYKLAVSEGWATEPASRPRRYLLDDIHATATRRRATRDTPPHDVNAEDA